VTIYFPDGEGGAPYPEDFVWKALPDGTLTIQAGPSVPAGIAADLGYNRTAKLISSS
jgi:hypothetical protein